MSVPKPDSPRGQVQQKIGRNSGLLLHPWNLKGVALVQLSQRTWYLVTTRIFFHSSVENLAVIWLDVLFMVHWKILLSPQVEYKVIHSSSSAKIMMMSSCVLEYLNFGIILDFPSGLPHTKPKIQINLGMAIQAPHLIIMGKCHTQSHPFPGPT